MEMSILRDSIISLAGLCVIGVTGFLVYERTPRPDSQVESYCNINMLRGGNCRFTVDTEGSGRTCVRVSLQNKFDSSNKDQTTVCSGLVGPKETKNISYTLDVSKVCDDDFDSCEFDVNEAP